MSSVIKCYTYLQSNIHFRIGSILNHQMFGKNLTSAKNSNNIIIYYIFQNCYQFRIFININFY